MDIDAFMNVKCYETEQVPSLEGFQKLTQLEKSFKYRTDRLKEKPKGEGQEGNFWQIVLKLNLFQKQKLTINQSFFVNFYLELNRCTI